MSFNIEVTGLYTALLAIWLLLLSFRVIQLRWKHRVGVGHGDVSELDKAVRIHGNFTEYIPIAIVLLAVTEVGGLSDFWLHVFGATLVIGRVFHAIGLAKTKGTSLPRQIGMMSTFISLLALAIIAITQFIG